MKTIPFMKVKNIMDSDRVRVNSIIVMEQFMMATGLKDALMGMEFCIIQINKRPMKENGKMINLMAMVWSIMNFNLMFRMILIIRILII